MRTLIAAAAALTLNLSPLAAQAQAPAAPGTLEDAIRILTQVNEANKKPDPKNLVDAKKELDKAIQERQVAQGLLDNALVSGLSETRKDLEQERAESAGLKADLAALTALRACDKDQNRIKCLYTVAIDHKGTRFGILAKAEADALTQPKPAATTSQVVVPEPGSSEQGSQTGPSIGQLMPSSPGANPDMLDFAPYRDCCNRNGPGLTVYLENYNFAAPRPGRRHLRKGKRHRHHHPHCGC